PVVWRPRRPGRPRLDSACQRIRIRYADLSISGHDADAPPAGHADHQVLREPGFIIRLTPMTIERRAARLACVFLVAASARVGAQTLPSRPIVFGDGLLTFGGDVSAGYGSADRGFFNYTDYDHSALRLFRV